LLLALCIFVLISGTLQDDLSTEITVSQNELIGGGGNARIFAGIWHTQDGKRVRVSPDIDLVQPSETNINEATRLL
jgi:hypothetical protein